MALRQAASLLAVQQPAHSALLCVGNALRKCFASSTSEKFTVEVCRTVLLYRALSSQQLQGRYLCAHLLLTPSCLAC